VGIEARDEMKSYFWKNKAVYGFTDRNIVVKRGFHSTQDKGGIWN
jgi:hypothetical protein